MNVRLLTITIVAVSAFCRSSGAETIWVWSHQASGMGTSNVFDGGPTEFGANETTGPDDDRMAFGASDATMPGSLGAKTSASGASRILPQLDGSLVLLVTFSARYDPSGFPGGDNPGGEAEGELFSVIEFLMPADELDWIYQLRIAQESPFTGSTSVLVENVTQGQTLLELDAAAPTTHTSLIGTQGDLIRMTTAMSGSGSMPPGSGRRYSADLTVLFAVPEPDCLTLLLTGVLLTLSRSRWDRWSRRLT